MVKLTMEHLLQPLLSLHELKCRSLNESREQAVRPNPGLSRKRGRAEWVPFLQGTGYLRSRTAGRYNDDRDPSKDLKAAHRAARQATRMAGRARKSP